MRRRRLLAVVAAGSAATVGCTDPVSDDGLDAEPPARVVESRLVRDRVGTDEETVAVEGVVERTTDEEITYLEVRVTFYSADDERLDTTVSHLEDVTEGDRWEFVVEYARVGDAAARVADHDAEVVRNP